MSAEHSAFLFDYDGFLRIFNSIQIELNSGNESKLIQMVEQIKNENPDPESWILHDKGTTIDNQGLDRDSRYKNGLLGHWILIVLSKFLKPCVSLGFKWNRISKALHYINWEQEDIWRALIGVPISSMVDRDVLRDRGSKWSDPYWYWISPDHSVYSGWLPFEEVVRLREQLLRDETQIGEKWRMLEDENIDKVIHDEIEIFDSAFKAGLGLYMIVYEE